METTEIRLEIGVYSLSERGRGATAHYSSYCSKALWSELRLTKFWVFSIEFAIWREFAPWWATILAKLGPAYTRGLNVCWPVFWAWPWRSSWWPLGRVPRWE